MNRTITVILATLIWSFCFSQKFSGTETYKVTEDEYTLDSIEFRPISLNGDTAYLRLVSTTNQMELFRVPIYSPWFDGFELETLKEIQLNNIDHIIRFKTIYQACCSDETSYYFLVTNDKKFISLPYFTETFCDGPEPYNEYIFSKDLIRLTRFYPNQENEIDSTKTLFNYRLENGKLKEEK